MVTGPVEARARTAGIVLMSLLSALLVFVLLRTRPPEHPQIQEAPRPQPMQSTGPQPAQQAPESAPPDVGEYYRGWPLFEGWPLPQLPSGTGGGGSQSEPAQSASPQLPQ